MNESKLSPEQTEIALKLIQIWDFYPSQRLNQLISNLNLTYDRKNGNRLRKTVYTSNDDFGEEVTYIDSFYLRDEDFLLFLKECHEELVAKRDGRGAF